MHSLIYHKHRITAEVAAVPRAHHFPLFHARARARVVLHVHLALPLRSSIVCVRAAALSIRGGLLSKLLSLRRLRRVLMPARTRCARMLISSKNAKQDRQPTY